MWIVCTVYSRCYFDTRWRRAHWSVHTCVKLWKLITNAFGLLCWFLTSSSETKKWLGPRMRIIWRLHVFTSISPVLQHRYRFFLEIHLSVTEIVNSVYERSVCSVWLWIIPPTEMHQTWSRVHTCYFTRSPSPNLHNNQLQENFRKDYYTDSPLYRKSRFLSNLY